MRPLHSSHMARQPYVPTPATLALSSGFLNTHPGPQHSVPSAWYPCVHREDSLSFEFQLNDTSSKRPSLTTFSSLLPLRCHFLANPYFRSFQRLSGCEKHGSKISDLFTRLPPFLTLLTTAPQLDAWHIIGTQRVFLG